MPIDRPPFPPSIFDRVFHWMSRRPTRRWLYVALYLFGVTTLLISTGIDGQTGTTRFQWVFINGLWIVIGYLSIDLIDTEVVRAADRFREVFPGSDDEFEDEVYRLSTMPARTATLVWGIAFVAFVIAANTLPALADLEDPVARLVQTPFMAASYSSAILLVYHTVRLLSGISRVLRTGNVSIFHLRPLYGFSRVTARVGVAYLAVMILNAISEAVLDLGGSRAELWIGVAVSIVLASASFVAPLVGTHRRILDAKSDALQENSEHLERIRADMYHALETGDHARFNELDGALVGLLKMGETIDKISSWPWSKGTVRGFFTAVGIPLVVFIAQRVLDAAL